MSQNITTLALNLIISESQFHRARIAGKISDLVNEIDSDSPVQQLMKQQLILQMNQYVLNPSREKSDIVFDLAGFYKKYFMEAGSISQLSIAA